ncbi:alpha/beta fold hydrolase [Spirochaeta isovalerica]|uniref:Pimeloyl-ACP methyl ester carboxylesterase n=1 Tax=Spirochaeta isovalerica TaxID=150 RepID=A0A841REM6_9SPIO|nr:alpha/beta hydrolase [Spirochaeta isovalerica]MBB6482066.1 pimeloyl-ACP methyl ester carboxylesterase [Spirochaeta isovalerica]
MKIDLIEMNGLKIEYCQSGDSSRQSIVFAHGLGSSLHQWKKQIEYFSQSFRVIAFSLQGHGASSQPVQPEVYSIESYGKTVQILLENLKVESCIWVGNSMGGVLGYYLRRMKPDLIRKLITNGTTPKLIMPPLLVNIVVLMDKLMIRLLKFKGYIRFAANHTSRIDRVKEDIFSIMSQSCPQAVIASHKILGNYDFLDSIPENPFPIHIIEGEYDKDINIYLDKYREIMKQSRIVTFHKIANAGHMANMDQPEKYNRILEEILKK